MQCQLKAKKASGEGPNVSKPLNWIAVVKAKPPQRQPGDVPLKQSQSCHDFFFNSFKINACYGYAVWLFPFLRPTHSGFILQRHGVVRLRRQSSGGGVNGRGLPLHVSFCSCVYKVVSY